MILISVNWCDGVNQVKNDEGLFYLPVDFQQLKKLCGVGEFYKTLEMTPKEALLCMGAAVHVVILC